MNRFLVFLAECGWFRYGGGEMFQPRWPRARVRYPDGKVSRPMVLGNAVDYRDIFGGEIIPVGEVIRRAERSAHE